ncbi:TniB family NTP-binding protein [Bradyrhizobium sp. CCBAU 65884]|uniref:TniB family NTP-binding protein n=1 Tax=Bradyrhizobium sp. CCBAU 65884 TaxID=722477 RepID=UPI003FA4C726
MQIPLVGVGTAEALREIRSDDQLVNRFEPIALPPWIEDEAYRRLLDCAVDRSFAPYWRHPALLRSLKMHLVSAGSLLVGGRRGGLGNRGVWTCFS